MNGQVNRHWTQPCLVAPQRLSRSHLSQAALALGSSRQVWAEGYPTMEQSFPTVCLPLPGIHQRCRAETDKPVLQATVGEAASLELPPSSAVPQGLYSALCCYRTRSPSNMAATGFVEEIRSVGERLLLKLQGLSQAEPVELVAFSIIVLFTGNHGPAADAAGLQLLLRALLLPRQETQEDPRATRKTQMRDSSVMTQEKLDRSLPEL
ncbi:Small integral membrane protein 5 [Lemmus lemmus]